MKKITRKQFFKRLLAAVMALEVLYVFFGSFSLKDREKKKTLIDVGEIDSFEKGRSYPFTSGKFFLKRFADGGFMAISTTCTHLGCMINVDGETGGFVCPCHSSKFDEFGNVTKSPAARTLDYFPIEEKEGKLFVNVNKAVRRDRFEKSQIMYASV